MIEFRKFISCLTCGIVFAFNLSAQTHEYRFENLTSSQGYPLRINGNLVQDYLGYIWLPTFDGVYRYDGYEFKKYEHKNSDSTSLSFNIIHSLFADLDGSIWAGTFGGGLNHLDPVTGKCHIYKKIISDSSTIGGDRVSVIYRDSENRLWVATPGEFGLSLFDDNRKTFRRIRMLEKGASKESVQKCNNIFGILEDTDKDLFFSSWDGLIWLHHESKEYSFHKCDTGNMREFNNLMGEMCLDESGLLWIATWGGGLKSFDKKTGLFKTYLWNKKAGISSSNNICKGVAVKSKDELWLAILDNKGFGPLAIFNTKEKSFSFITNNPQDPKSIADETGGGLFKDKNGNIWITMGRNGVSLLDLDKQSLPFIEMPLKIFPDLPGPSITSFWKDTMQQKLFMGTTWSNGLYCLDLKTQLIKHIPDNYTSPGGNINIVFVKNNKVFLSGDALQILDPVKQTISPFNPQPPAEILHLTEDKKGNLWGITKDCFLFFDSPSGKWKSFPVSFGIKGSNFALHGVACYNDGTIWTGSDENGLFVINPETHIIRNIRKSNENKGLPFNTVIDICIDNKGRLWCGGIGGIAIYDPTGNHDRFHNVSIENGLTSDYVNELSIDGEGFIWCTTLSALSKIDPENFSITNYEKHSGLFKKQQITGLYISYDNEIFTGSEIGFSHFYPEQLKKDLKQPDIVISSFKIFDKVYPLQVTGKNVTVNLGYNQNYFSFEFAALTFNNVDQNQYAYKLDGFDKNWIYSRNRRYAAYTNIPGGEYIFRVKAANKDGVWNETGLSVPIFISTAWWKTPWFFFVLSVVVAGTAYALYLYRIRQLKAIFAIRNNLAADLHDEVGSSLSNIQLLSEMLPSHSETMRSGIKEQKIVEQIRENARGTLEGMYDIIWNLNPKNDQIEFMISRLKEQTAPFAEAKNIHLQWDTKNLDVSVKLPLEKRKDLYLACKEGIQNALKYSACNTLGLKAVTENQTITITISDNGKGFIKGTSGRGNGLLNMKQRMERWNGHCEINSTTSGTTLILCLKA